jgi:hypothetical protein
MTFANHSPVDDDTTYPALRFERFFGLRDIGQRWAMPNGMTMKAVEAELKREVIFLDNGPPSQEKTQSFLQRSACGQSYARAFNALNPRLSAIQADWDNWKHLRGFLHGVTSGFNEDDINEWIHGRTDAYECDPLRNRIAAQFYRNPEKSWYPESLREKFNDRARIYSPLLLAHIHWIPCTKTIRRINEQLDAKVIHKKLSL